MNCPSCACMRGVQLKSGPAEYVRVFGLCASRRRGRTGYPITYLKPSVSLLSRVRDRCVCGSCLAPRGVRCEAPSNCEEENATELRRKNAFLHFGRNRGRTVQRSPSKKKESVPQKRVWFVSLAGKRYTGTAASFVGGECQGWKTIAMCCISKWSQVEDSDQSPKPSIFSWSCFSFRGALCSSSSYEMREGAPAMQAYVV